jgi:hypothetical protein
MHLQVSVLALTPLLMVLTPIETASDSNAAVPLALRIEWDGPVCNPDGDIRVTVRNLSAKDIALPRNGGLGSLFIARISVQDEVTSTVGHGYNIPYLLDEMKKEDVVILHQGERFTYKFTMLDKYEMSLDEFSPKYEIFNRIGGRIGFIYSLMDFDHESIKKFPFYFVNYDLNPFISSNTLVCKK